MPDGDVTLEPWGPICSSLMVAIARLTTADKFQFMAAVGSSRGADSCEETGSRKKANGHHAVHGAGAPGPSVGPTDEKPGSAQGDALAVVVDVQLPQRMWCRPDELDYTPKVRY